MDIKEMIKNKMGIALEEEVRNTLGEKIKNESITELQARERHIKRKEDSIYQEYEEKVQAIEERVSNDINVMVSDMYNRGYRKGDRIVYSNAVDIETNGEIEKSNLKEEYQEKLRINNISLSEVQRAIGQFEIEHKAEIEQVRKENKLQEAREYLGIKEAILQGEKKNPIQSTTGTNKDMLRQEIDKRFRNSMI